MMKLENTLKKRLPRKCKPQNASEVKKEDEVAAEIKNLLQDDHDLKDWIQLLIAEYPRPKERSFIEHSDLMTNLLQNVNNLKKTKLNMGPIDSSDDEDTVEQHSEP